MSRVEGRKLISRAYREIELSFAEVRKWDGALRKRLCELLHDND